MCPTDHPWQGAFQFQGRVSHSCDCTDRPKGSRKKKRSGKGKQPTNEQDRERKRERKEGGGRSRKCHLQFAQTAALGLFNPMLLRPRAKQPDPEAGRASQPARAQPPRPTPPPGLRPGHCWHYPLDCVEGDDQLERPFVP